MSSYHAAMVAFASVSAAVSGCRLGSCCCCSGRVVSIAFGSVLAIASALLCERHHHIVCHTDYRVQALLVLSVGHPSLISLLPTYAKCVEINSFVQRLVELVFGSGRDILTTGHITGFFSRYRVSAAKVDFCPSVRPSHE